MVPVDHHPLRIQSAPSVQKLTLFLRIRVNFCTLADSRERAGRGQGEGLALGRADSRPAAEEAAITQ